jgi:hypothetical protein
MSKRADYRHKAEICESEARFTQLPEIRSMWLQIAESYRNLAESEARAEEERRISPGLA